MQTVYEGATIIRSACSCFAVRWPGGNTVIDHMHRADGTARDTLDGAADRTLRGIGRSPGLARP
jgi:hypothetical protein